MYVWPSQLNQHAKPGACSIEEVVIHIIQYIFIYIYYYYYYNYYYICIT